MDIVITNTRLFFDVTPEENDYLDDLLKIREKNAWYSPKFRSHQWDGYKHFYSKISKTCDTGFLPMIVDAASEDDLELNVIEDRSRLKKQRKSYSIDEWHEFISSKISDPHHFVSYVQAKAAKKAFTTKLGTLRWNRGVLSIATGGGKTSLAANLCKVVGLPTVILLGRLDLLYQTKESLELLLDEKVGILGDTERDIQRVTILMSQTASKLFNTSLFKKFIKNQAMVILDEAHHLQADRSQSYVKVLRQATNAYYRYALTATPCKRKDTGDYQLIGCFGPIIYEMNSLRLRQEGALADVKCFIADYESNDLDKNLRGAAAKKQGVFINYDRHKAIADYALKFVAKNLPCMILVDRVLQHGVSLQEFFKMYTGMSIPLINFKTKVSERQSYLSQLESGKIKILIASVGVFGEGVNAPNIRALIRAEGGASEIRTLQAVGRGMRRKEGENTLYLIDFNDITHPSLKKDSKKRFKIYAEEKYEIEKIQSQYKLPF